MTNAYATCPYNNLVDTSKWIRAVTEVENSQINPNIKTDFLINKQTKIATAGSCFAQNLARALNSSGFNYYCVEPVPGWLSQEYKVESFNYGVFSARYGNIYTPRQLLQLIQRAVGTYHPIEPAWKLVSGKFVDPFRPRIQKYGFDSLAEMHADRDVHLGLVLHMLKSLDVFVFTLGLTECWRSREDGAIFPVAPGCGAGEFDMTRHEFYNFNVNEIISDLSQSIELLLSLNANAKILLTVSPVPLVATMSGNHVLQATIYSKSVLRVAAEEITGRYPSVHYFAAYEIATATLNSHYYFGSDKRSVTDPLVSHVMRCFFDTYAPGTEYQMDPSIKAQVQISRDIPEPVMVVCDEEAINEALASQISSKGLEQ